MAAEIIHSTEQVDERSYERQAMVSASQASQALAQESLAAAEEGKSGELKANSSQSTSLADYLPAFVTENIFADKIYEWKSDREYKSSSAELHEQWDKEARCKNISLDPVKLQEFYDKNLERLDQNGDLAVTTRELDKSRGSFSGEEGDLLRALWMYGDEVKTLSNDDNGFERGITRQDVGRLVENWGCGDSLGLVDKINYVGKGNLKFFRENGPNFTGYQHQLRDSWAKGGGWTGMALGGLGGAALTDLSGGLLFPTIPLGALYGGHYGMKAGEYLGGIRASFASEAKYLRSYVEENLKRD